MQASSLCISLSIPLLQQPGARARYMTSGGAVSEECLCVLDPPQSGLTLAACLTHWQVSSGLFKAFVAAPPVLCIPIVRFIYDDRRLCRHSATVQLEHSEAVPVFLSNTNTEMEMVTYWFAACILHRGPTPNSGHYRTLVYCNRGFVIADDDCWSDYIESPSSEDLSQTYVLFLVKV